MEFIMNEQGCSKLSTDMLTAMRQIAGLVSEIQSQNGTLRSALGEDYDAIARSVSIMTRELTSAQSELNVIIADMNEYIERVHQARIALN